MSLDIGIPYIFQHNLYSFILFIFYIFITHSDIGIPRVVTAAFWHTYTQLVEQATVSSVRNSYSNLWRWHSIFFTNSSYRKHCPCSGNRSFVYTVVPSPTGQREKKAITDLEYDWTGQRCHIQTKHLAAVSIIICLLSP